MRKRILKYFLFLVFLVLFITILFSSEIARKYYTAEVENKLQGLSFAIEYYLTDTDNNPILDYGVIARDFAEKYNVDNNLGPEGLRITFVDFTGQVLGDSEIDYREMDNHLDRAEVQEALKNGKGEEIRYSNTVKANMLYVTRTLEDQQVLVRVSIPLVQLQQIEKSIRFYSLLILVVAMILAVIVSLSFSGSITKPLKDLTFASQEIANGNYNKRIAVRGNDELGQLAQNFNEMGAKLDLTIADLQRKRAQIESIVNSLAVGLVAVDKYMRIILLNPAAVGFFAINDGKSIIGTRIIEHIRHNQIISMLNETIEKNATLYADVAYNGMIFQVNTNPIKANYSYPDNSGGIIFLQDITKIRKLEQLRTEFVSNVTHELKTPITSIKGFTETLKSGAIDNKEVAVKFLDIIDIEAERLYNLINDILQLSEIENKEESGLESFSLREVVADALLVVENMAIEKQVSLENLVDYSIKLNANRNRIKQLFLNLLDNGIKYNVSGGSVTITAYCDPGKVVISVKDTGIGVPAEHQARIFERFYRVDKGRSKERGGTGLGLSIVKHIVQLYNGDIKVRSEVNQGTEFVIQLPI